MKSEIESPTLPPSAAATSKPKKRKLSSEPPKLSRDERFYELFKTALQGLCTQFEDASNPRYANGKAELERGQDLARRAWNLATYATSMFEDVERTIEAFNEEVKLSKIGDEQ